MSFLCRLYALIVMVFGCFSDVGNAQLISIEPQPYFDFQFNCQLMFFFLFLAQCSKTVKKYTAYTNITAGLNSSLVSTHLYTFVTLFLAITNLIPDATTGESIVLTVVGADHYRTIVNQEATPSVTSISLSKRPKATVHPNAVECPTVETGAHRHDVKATAVGTATSIFPTTGAFHNVAYRSFTTYKGY